MVAEHQVTGMGTTPGASKETTLHTPQGPAGPRRAPQAAERTQERSCLSAWWGHDFMMTSMHDIRTTVVGQKTEQMRT